MWCFTRDFLLTGALPPPATSPTSIKGGVGVLQMISVWVQVVWVPEGAGQTSAEGRGGPLCIRQRKTQLSPLHYFR